MKKVDANEEYTKLGMGNNNGRKKTLKAKLAANRFIARDSF